ncbi:hypothetical protein KY284_001499 [Solanum tuberosum]|nr:hypothetical protein KY284_001499 [Solanum tuberosum]
MMARLRVHIFLNGLDAKFDQVCGEILRKDPKLDLESTYASVQREAQQRQTMGSARLIPKSSTMAFHHSSSFKGRTNQSSDWWDFLKKPRKVIPNRVVAMTTSGTNQPNNNGKIEPRVNMTQPGITSNNNVNVNVTALSTNNTWIIASGSSDHMTKDPSKLQSLKPSSKPFISIANSGTSPVIGEGPIVLTDALRLDRHSNWGTLGYGVKRHNLYFLELPKGGEKKFSHAFRTYGIEKARDNIA